MKQGESFRKSHIEKCRKRIEALMACDPEFRVKLDEAHARGDRWLADEVARCDEWRWSKL